jgi:DegV family protein with EDD domain
MNLDEVLIVADSSSDTLKVEGINFKSVPLKIITKEREFVDDGSLDTEEMMKFLISYSGRSSTSCPGIGEYVEAFAGYKYVFCITITSALSGSYSSALAAKRIFEKEHPYSQVCLIDSLSTGAEMVLLIEKLRELILSGKDFDTVESEIRQYQKKTGLVFMLKSIKNLANNGRVNHVVARVAEVLKISIVGKASDEGEFQQLDKCRGESRAFAALIKRLREEGFAKGKIAIGHCCNPDAARSFAEMVRKEFSNENIHIFQTRGLCCFYAELGGLMIGFEKD